MGLFLLPLFGMGQFYNGHQMTFGKSRVQYNDFYWQYYRFDKFDTYFYVGGNKLAEYVSKVAMEQMESMEYLLDQILQRRIIFIVYNKQSEFRQSNIGLVTGNEEYNIGGVVRIVDNKVFLYYEGDHQKLKNQIRASIVEILANEMLYGGSFRSRVSSSVMLNLPEWYLPGLISFFSYDSDFDTEAKIKNILLDDKSRKLHHLHGDEAKYAGHSLWRYISETYGRETVSSIVYMTRITRSAESGFLYVIGVPLKDVVNDWYYYYSARYNDEVASRAEPSDSQSAIKKKPKRKRTYSQVKISPNGNYIAYTTNQSGKYIIWLYNTQTDKSKRIVRREHKIEQITDYSYPILAWHPTSQILNSIYERKGKIWLDYYDVDTEEKQHRELFYVDKVLDFSYSHDGQEIVFSAVDNGYTDIFIYSVVASTFTRITNDIADDLNPRFVDNSSKIIFSSNRVENRVKYDKGEETPTTNYYDLFIYDYKQGGNNFERLSNTHRTNEISPTEIAKDKYVYLSNSSGITNEYYLAKDSIISYIDTAIHYRNQITNQNISNNPFTIEGYDYNKNNGWLVDNYKRIKKYAVVKKDLSRNEDDVENTWFRDYFNNHLEADSILKAELDKPLEPDSVITQFIEQYNNDSVIDINYYIFDVEKNRNKSFGEEKNGGNAKLFKWPKQMVYFTNFYNNVMVTQIDFGFMNQSYQTYSGGAYYYNPGMNLHTKAGAIDLFEDYKITAAISWSFDLRIDEFLFSIENLKRRLDKQYIYYRHAYDSYNASVRSHTLMGVFKYPLTQIYGFKATVSVRDDNLIYKSVNDNSLKAKDEMQWWCGVKGEFVFDNTRKLAINTYTGTRLKIFGEYYLNFGNEVNQNMFVVGFDARNYFPIHRDLIFATRIAGSSSFGNALLIYYLGGVDNWVNLSSKTPTFDYSTQINQDKNWAYQAVATNMRGFIQNARNGNTFGVLNAELRWPIIRYLYNRPISNDLLNNFMLIGFTDVGAAWDGWNPFNANNAYDFEPKQNGPVTVIIDRKRSALIEGVGFGVRSRLLGYYVRADWAWGIDGGRVLPRVFYLSLSTDF